MQGGTDRLPAACICCTPVDLVIMLWSVPQGYAAFARLMGDETEEMQQVMADYNIKQVGWLARSGSS